jgi:hypothetical protein
MEYLESLYSENQEYDFVSWDEVGEENLPYSENLYIETIEKEHLNKIVDVSLNKIYNLDGIVLRGLFGLNDKRLVQSLDEISREFTPKIGEKSMKKIKDRGLRLMRSEMKRNF